MNTKVIQGGCLTVITVAVLAGCTSVPPAAPALREQALSFRPPPGESAVYIICPKYFLDGCARWTVNLDGQKSSALKIGSFLYTPVWPGEHAVIKFNDDPPTGIIFIANEGQNCFVTVGPSYSNTKFRMLTAEAGEKYVRNYEMSGDNFYQIPFLPGTIDSNATVACHIVLAQDDPFVATDVVQPTDHSLAVALAEAMVAGVVDKKYATKAKRMSLPLQGHGLGQLFRTNFQTSFTTAIKKSSWFHTDPIDITRETKNVTAAEISQRPVMQIHLIYGLSPDASSLIMRAELLYFRQGNPNATYDGHYTYVSEPLPVENDKAITQWSAADETLLRTRMDEGMNDLISMMDIDFFHRKQRSPDKRSMTILFYEPYYKSLMNYTGFVVRDEGPRKIVQSRSGDMLSVVPNVTPLFY